MKRLPAYRAYLILETTLAFLFDVIFAASMVYQVETVGLSALQLVLVGTTLELTVFLFEIPTGVVADVYSRRLSIIIGMVLIGAGFLVEGSFPVFGAVLLAQVMWGLGYTFTSGATQAWITDEIGEEAAGRAFLRSTQLGLNGAVAGMAVGTALGAWRLNLPIQLGGFSIILLGGFLALWMPEDGFKPALGAERSSWARMWGTFREGWATVRLRPSLKTILWIGLIYGLYSEGFDRLWTKHILDSFSLPFSLTPVVFIGIVRIAGMLLSVGATELANRRINTERATSLARGVWGFTALLVAGLFVFALARTLPTAILAYWLISISRNVIGPLYTAWVNQRIESRVRATVLSMSSQVDAIGQILGGPVVGLVGSLISVRAALLSSALILSPALGLFARAIRLNEEPPLLDGTAAEEEPSARI